MVLSFKPLMNMKYLDEASYSERTIKDDSHVKWFRCHGNSVSQQYPEIKQQPQLLLINLVCPSPTPPSSHHQCQRVHSSQLSVIIQALLTSNNLTIMVSASSTTSKQSAKRKKTEDMPDSPPKRVTRARAKASSSGDGEPEQSTVTTTTTRKITTASAKLGAQTKRVAKAVKVVKGSKRSNTKAKDGDGNVDPVRQADGEEPLVKESTKSRTRRKRVDEEEAVGKSTVVKNSAHVDGRRAKIPVQVELHAEAPKARGRPKKVVVAPIPASTDVKQQPEKPEPVIKAVRGRAAAIASKPIPESSTTTAPTRKRVKFQDESEKDKENIQQLSSLKKPLAAKTGLKAKPVRIPTASRTTTRSKKAQDAKKLPDHGEEAEEARPLSPKKVKQIAKSFSVGSEDELCRERTPVRALSKSPVKPPISTVWEMDKPAPKTNFDEVTLPSSPTKSIAFTILASPARRPPPSPFKDSLKESPKRVNLGDSMAPVSKSVQSPTKATLLQSPAKRLVFSCKPMAAASLKKLDTELPSNKSLIASAQAKQLKTPLFSPSKMFSSPVRAVKSPESPFKIHQTKPLEQKENLALEVQVLPREINSLTHVITEKLISNASPQEESTATTEAIKFRRSPPQPFKDDDTESAVCETTILDAEHDGVSIPNEAVKGTTSPEPVAPFAALSFSFASRLSFGADESESEDELVSPSKGSNISNILPRAVSTTLQSEMTQGGFEWSPIPTGTTQIFSMTPLATQLGGWVATSPEKTASKAPYERKRGLFSPFGPTFVGQPAQCIEKNSDLCVNGDSESPYKSSFFEDCFHPEMVTDQDHDPATQLLTCEVMTEEADGNGNSQASEEYGDENALPMGLDDFDAQPHGDNLDLTCTPATVFALYPREIHTVSKVPLRPAGDDSPLKMPRKRSRSFAGSSQMINAAEKSRTHGFGRGFSKENDSFLSNVLESTGSSMEDSTTTTKSVIALPRTPGSAVWSNYGTPGRTVRKGLVPNVLKGAVVYVDVHTSEGADASGIFLDLLTQMGARCVKQWLWNPRNGAPSTGDDSASASDSDGPVNKIGITHVVYKDGGKRTLEKVREAKGVVLCVGVGWVLEYVSLSIAIFRSLRYAD
jgi:hypothetical protein